VGLRAAGHSKSKRLAILAEPLAPERPPWWVAEPRGRTPSQGWWWIPHGEQHPQFLGHNGAIAEMNVAAARAPASTDEQRSRPHLGGGSRCSRGDAGARPSS
jgi:hypothetical protein